jgi:hypothetical protein
VLGESSASIFKQITKSPTSTHQPPKTKKTHLYYYINNTITSNSIIPLFCTHIHILAVNLIPISTGVKKQDGKQESTTHTDPFSFHFKNIVVLITKTLFDAAAMDAIKRSAFILNFLFPVSLTLQTVL